VSGDVNELPVMGMSRVVCCGTPSERDPKQTTIESADRGRVGLGKIRGPVNKEGGEWRR